MALPKKPPQVQCAACGWWFNLPAKSHKFRIKVVCPSCKIRLDVVLGVTCPKTELTQNDVENAAATGA